MTDDIGLEVTVEHQGWTFQRFRNGSIRILPGVADGIHNKFEPHDWAKIIANMTCSRSMYMEGVMQAIHGCA